MCRSAKPDLERTLRAAEFRRGGRRASSLRVSGLPSSSVLSAVVCGGRLQALFLDQPLLRLSLQGPDGSVLLFTVRLNMELKTLMDAFCDMNSNLTT